MNNKTQFNIWSWFATFAGLMSFNMRHGMSEKLGRVALYKDQRSFLIPSQITACPQPRDYGEATADAIDRDVRTIVDGAFERMIRLLKDRRDLLERTARRLLEKETLEDADPAALSGTRAEVGPRLSVVRTFGATGVEL